MSVSRCRPLEDGNYMVNSMVEKPDTGDVPGNLAIIGRYILMQHPARQGR